MQGTVTERDLTQVIKAATYTLPVWAWQWLKDEAKRRDTSASGLIVALIAKERGEESEAAA